MSSDSDSSSGTESTSESQSSSHSVSNGDDKTIVQGLAVPHLDGPLDWYLLNCHCDVIVFFPVFARSVSLYSLSLSLSLSRSLSVAVSL
jgi:hypothetical protein